MPRPAIRCPHCGKIDWTRAPRLKRIVDEPRCYNWFALSELAEWHGISRQNAHKALAALYALGLAEREHALDPRPIWGVRGVYRLIKES